jgi:hypothetical protein
MLKSDTMRLYVDGVKVGEGLKSGELLGADDAI